MNMLCLRRLALLLGAVSVVSTQASERLPGKEREGYVTVDYLAWKAQEDQLQYAVVVPNGLPTTIPFSVLANIIEPCFNFDSGVRVEAGYFFCSDWDVWASWTHFHQCSRNSATSPTPESTIVPPLNNIVGTPAPTTNNAVSRFGLHFDTVSANVGRYFTPWDCVSLETYFGVEWARIHQKQLLSYEDLLINSVLLQLPAQVNRYNNFSGVGPTLGAQFIWSLGSSDFSLFGSAAGALLVGKFCTQVNNVLTYPSTVLPVDVNLLGIHEVTLTAADPTLTVNTYESKCRVRPTADVQVGLGWEHTFCGRFGLQLRVAFEAQIWQNQWQASGSVFNVTGGTLPGGGDLTLYGATLGAGFLF